MNWGRRRRRCRRPQIYEELHNDRMHLGVYRFKTIHYMSDCTIVRT